MTPDPHPPRRGDWMQTFTGRRFWPSDPHPRDICIEDIAHGLSMTCRYGGQSARFYSVAEHCVHCARLAPADLRLAALMHDASEAYIGDMPQPAKTDLHDFRRMEERIMAAVGGRYGVSEADWAAVKPIDMHMLAVEVQQVFRGGPRHDWNPGILQNASKTPRLEFWIPAIAERRFLEAFSAIGAPARRDAPMIAVSDAIGEVPHG